MSEMTECKDCIYYYDDSNESQCRKHPPGCLPNGSGWKISWPPVDPNDGNCCGEGEEPE